MSVSFICILPVGCALIVSHTSVFVWHITPYQLMGHLAFLTRLCWPPDRQNCFSHCVCVCVCPIRLCLKGSLLPCAEESVAGVEYCPDLWFPSLCTRRAPRRVPPQGSVPPACPRAPRMGSARPGVPPSKQASYQASDQASKLPSKHTSYQSSYQATKQATNQSSYQASYQALSID